MTIERIAGGILFINAHWDLHNIAFTSLDFQKLGVPTLCGVEGTEGCLSESEMSVLIPELRQLIEMHTIQKILPRKDFRE